LHAVRAFEAAARHLSITRAADELNVTVSAVSRHVRALEARMGTALFLRGSRGLVLTSAGKTFAESAREALDRIADAADGLRLRVSGGCRSASTAFSFRASCCRSGLR
jgi:LysR family glycine cleavage system transcriptional activator